MPNGEWDIFGWRCGLGLPVRWFDVDAIIALLDDTLQGVSTIDQLVMNWNGEEEVTWEHVRELLRATGYFAGLNAKGEITFARLRLATIADAASPVVVAPIPSTLVMQPTEGEGIDRIHGFLGVLPWDAGSEFEVNILGDRAVFNPPDSLRSGLFGQTRDIEFDLSVLADSEEAALQMLSVAVFRGFGSPTLEIRANDGRYAHGDILKVLAPGTKDPWFVAPDGTAVDPNDDAKWFGQVVGFRRNIKNNTVDLTLLMHNWHLNGFPRLRAPSAIFASGAGPTYTVDAYNFLGASGTDAGEFTVGDVCEIWSDDGVRRSGTSAAPDSLEILTIVGNDITFDGSWVTPPVLGDVIRLSHLDDVNGFPEDGNPNKFALALAYVYAADDAETLGPNDLDAHIYGFGLI